jgi:UDP-glucose 4-epimerase
VLVSGAGGFLGRHVVDRLLQRGHEVRAIIRPAATEPVWTRNVEIFRADLRVHDALVTAFLNVDAVIHLAAATSGSEEMQFTTSVIATERFLEGMAQSSVRRLIHVSSLVVYDWLAAKNMMNEETPLLTNIYDMGAYTVAKVWQERIVKRAAKSHSWDLTIMRPGFVWGPEHAEIAGMGRRFGRAYLLFGPLTRLPLTHVANCADCLALATECPKAIGETFNVIDGDDVRVWRYVREFMRRGGGPRGVLLPVPYLIGFGLARVAALVSRMIFGKKGKLPSLLVPRRFEAQFKPIRFSSKKIRERLGWAPPLSFDRCLASTYGSRQH